MLTHPPLRTVRESFPSYGSGLSKPTCASRFRYLQVKGMDLPVAYGMHKAQVAVVVSTAIDTTDNMVNMPSGFGRDQLLT